MSHLTCPPPLQSEATSRSPGKKRRQKHLDDQHDVPFTKQAKHPYPAMPTANLGSQNHYTPVLLRPGQRGTSVCFLGGAGIVRGRQAFAPQVSLLLQVCLVLARSRSRAHDEACRSPAKSLGAPRTWPVTLLRILLPAWHGWRRHLMCQGSRGPGKVCVPVFCCGLFSRIFLCHPGRLAWGLESTVVRVVQSMV
jgi:hypothetical protein